MPCYAEAMGTALRFDKVGPQDYEQVIRLSPRVRRIMARNPGPFTFTGTATYIVGAGEVAVIDPGPEDEAHLRAILEAVKGERISHILVTHTHRDHTGGLRALAEATGAMVVGCGPHRAARAMAEEELNPLDASVDHDYRPDMEMLENDAVSGPDWTLRALPTPGHTANHLAFAFEEENALFSGDHVMGWSTSIVAPPDGSMRDYIASLRKLLTRAETRYYPGHGREIDDPREYVAGLLAHREVREAQVLQCLAEGETAIPDMVRRIYPALPPALTTAAGLSVLAHLEDLMERGLVQEISDLQKRYRLSAPPPPNP